MKLTLVTAVSIPRSAMALSLLLNLCGESPSRKKNYGVAEVYPKARDFLLFAKPPLIGEPPS